MSLDQSAVRLESALTELGRSASYPPMPDLTDRVLSAVAERQQRRPIPALTWPAPGRAALAVATTAVLGLALGIFVLVPQLNRVSAAEVIREAIGDFADIPRFQATIRYDLNPDGADPDMPRGATAEIALSYGVSGAFRQEIHAITQGVPGSGGAGSFLVFDGASRIGEYRADENDFFTYEPWEGFEPLREFSWSAPYPNWEDICARGGSEVLADEEVAGRNAHHIRCGDWTGEHWELWIDAETGLILKLAGELGRDDYRLGTTMRGGFEVTHIEYDARFDPESFRISPPPNAELVPGTDPGRDYPSMRLTFTREFHGTFSGVLSYRDADGWRLDFTEETSDFIADVDSGTLLWNGAELVLYDAVNNWYSSSPEVWLPPLLWFEPTTDAAFDAGACDQVRPDLVGGRAARHLVCGNWQQVPGLDAEVWLDAEIGIYLRIVSPDGYGLDVSAVEIDPAFDAESFVFTPPPGAQTAEDFFADPYLYTDLTPGDTAPIWEAPLLGGGAFDLEAELGRPLLFLLMPDSCPRGDPVCDVLPQLQKVHEASGDRVGVVWIDLDGDADEASDTMERLGYTFPVVLDPGSRGDATHDSPEDAWAVTGWPLYVMLDAEGRVVEVRLGPQSVAELKEMLNAGD